MDYLNCGNQLFHQCGQHFSFQYLCWKDKSIRAHFWISFEQKLHHFHNNIHADCNHVQHTKSQNTPFNIDGFGWCLYLLLFHLPLPNIHALEMLIPLKKRSLNRNNSFRKIEDSDEAKICNHRRDYAKTKPKIARYILYGGLNLIGIGFGILGVY